MINVAINGFGRIGRAAFKIVREREDMRVVAINDLTDASTLAHLLSYDTAYGPYAAEVLAAENTLVVDGERYPVVAEPDPAKLPWGKYQVDVVLECTGRFVDGEGAAKHLTAGAKRVVISAPAKGGDVPTFLMGVNHGDVTAAHRVVSNASCTTNCISPVVDVINSAFGVEKAMMTTVHSYTADQNLHDGPHRDLRRARAAASNIVPTTTGAAIATTEVIPDLRDRFDGLAIRVPTIVVSLSDITFLLKDAVTPEEVNAVLTRASQSDRYRGIIGVTDKPLVSSDFIGTTYSGVVDLSLTDVVDGTMLKVIVWYDNEWGYSHRLVDMAATVGATV